MQDRDPRVENTGAPGAPILSRTATVASPHTRGNMVRLSEMPPVTTQSRPWWVRVLGDRSDCSRELLGNKGAQLADMTALGLPVPPGFTITTETCRAYYGAGGGLPEGVWPEVQSGIMMLEEATRRRFGDPSDPLLVSVPVRRGGIHVGNDGHRAEPGD